MKNLINFIQEKYLIDKDTRIESNGVLLLDTDLSTEDDYDNLMKEFEKISENHKWGFVEFRDNKISETNAPEKDFMGYCFSLEKLIDRVLTWKDKKYEIYLENGVIRIDVINGNNKKHYYVYKLKNKETSLKVCNAYTSYPKKMSFLNDESAIEAISVNGIKQNLVL